jgi:hypothetical protein
VVVLSTVALLLLLHRGGMGMGMGGAAASGDETCDSGAHRPPQALQRQPSGMTCVPSRCRSGGADCCGCGKPFNLRRSKHFCSHPSCNPRSPNPRHRRYVVLRVPMPTPLTPLSPSHIPLTPTHRSPSPTVGSVTNAVSLKNTSCSELAPRYGSYAVRILRPPSTILARSYCTRHVC